MTIEKRKRGRLNTILDSATVKVLTSDDRGLCSQCLAVSLCVCIKIKFGKLKLCVKPYT